MKFYSLFYGLLYSHYLDLGLARQNVLKRLFSYLVLNIKQKLVPVTFHLLFTLFPSACEGDLQVTTINIVFIANNDLFNY